MLPLRVAVRARAAVVGWVVLSLAAVGAVVVAGAAEQVPFSGFRQSGHWVFDRTIGAAFHIDGATKNVDATVTNFIAGAGGSSLALQGDSRGYVLRQGAIDVFDTPSLSVDTRIPMTIDEEPVGIEVAGGPYLVYRRTGTAVRLDLPPSVVQLGGPVGDPVATDDGALWVHRTDTGSLCRIPPGSVQLVCAATVPAGHRGSLSVVGGRATFVDTTSASAYPVNDDGLGTPVRLGAAVPTGALPAKADLDGWLPVLDRAGPTLIMADVRGVGGGGSAAAAPVRVKLAAGSYREAVSGQNTVALIDQKAGKVLVFDGKGRAKASARVPGGARKARITRGEDRRLYLDNAAGTHILVVDTDGSVTTVPVNGADVPAAGTDVLPTPPTAKTPKAPRGSRNRGGSASAPPAPPGPPGSVTAQPGNASARVSWTAADPRRPAVTAYLLTWRDTAGLTGTRTVRGNQRSTTLTGLVNGTTYVVSVLAQNRLGRGPATDSAPFAPSSEVPGAPAAVRATAAAADGSVSVSWDAADGQGHRITRYDVTASGTDGSTAQVAQTSDTSATVGGLTAGVTYTFTVVATNDLGIVGPTSPAGGPATPLLRAEAPTNVSASAFDGGATVDWTAGERNGGELVNYVVSGDGVADRTVSGGPVRFESLNNGTEYTFRVRAVTRSREGGASYDGAVASATTKPGRTAYADVLGVSMSGDRQARVRLDLHLFNSGAATCRLIFDGAQRWSGGCDSEITVGGLDYARTYDVYASLVNDYGTGGTGSHGSVRTNDPPPPPPSISVGRGSPVNLSFCNTPSCAKVDVGLRNFSAGARVSITCVSGGPLGGTGDSYTYTVTTDNAGSSNSNTCVYGYPGQRVWARANGIESNHFVW